MNSSSGVNQQCLAAHEGTGDAWKCMFAEHTAPHLATPTFALQSSFDQWQIGCEAELSDAGAINVYGQKLISLMEQNFLGANEQHGVFLDSCYHHGWEWGNLFVEGTSNAFAFKDWYERGSTALPNKGYYKQGQTYPCESCCHAPAPPSPPPAPTPAGEWQGPFDLIYSDDDCPNLGCRDSLGVEQCENLCGQTAGCNAFNFGQAAGGGCCLRSCQPEKLARPSTALAGDVSYYIVSSGSTPMVI